MGDDDLVAAWRRREVYAYLMCGKEMLEADVSSFSA